jgi:hypothetical protein
VKINLNTGTRDEFTLIPGVGARMSAEFAEYRPWKSWAQFDKEIGKYVGQQETDRFNNTCLSRGSDPRDADPAAGKRSKSVSPYLRGNEL